MDNFSASGPLPPESPSATKQSAAPSAASLSAQPQNHGAQASQRDPLTGFYTQRCLEQRLNQLLARNRTQPQQATLAHLQLQNFYELRSWLGKADANLLLGDLAQLVNKSLPPKVMVARRAKYEFAALLWDEASVDARRVTHDIKTLIQSASQSLSPRKLEIRCEIGLAQVDCQSNSPEVLFARARHSMGAANRLRANQLEQLSVQQEGKLLREVQTALRSNSLCLNFQALLNTGEESSVLYEVRTSLPTATRAAAVGQDPLAKNRVASSGQLFAVASKYGLAEALDRWLLRQCLQVLSSEAGGELQLVVNLTHNSIVSDRFIPWLSKQLESNPTAANGLLFQLSEIDVLIAQHHIGQFADRLTMLGCTLCIAHFGCTDNPFRYLDLFRARYVKLDDSLFRHHMHSANPAAQLAETVSKLHDRGLRVAVGMIDDLQQLPGLWQSKVNLLQGFCVHRPSHRLDFEPVKEQVLDVH